MNSKPPFIAQERDDTCAVACLRMLLAYEGKEVSEGALLNQVSLEEGGVDPDRLVDLARAHGLKAEVRQLDLKEIASLVQRQQFPIVLIERTFLDREFAIHAVIPIRVTRQFVVVLDPLRGERRISRRKFTQARRRLGWWAVLCELRTQSPGNE